MKMNPLNIYIILPGLFGVCPQTREFFILLIQEGIFMEWGFLWKKNHRASLEEQYEHGVDKRG